MQEDFEFVRREEQLALADLGLGDNFPINEYQRESSPYDADPFFDTHE